MERFKKRENLQNQKNLKKNKRYSKNSGHRKDILRYNQSEGFFLKRDIQNDVIVDKCNTIIESVNPYFNQNLCRFAVLYNEELVLYLLRFLPISSIINLMGTNQRLRQIILDNLKYIIVRLDNSFPINCHFQIVFKKPNLQKQTFYDRVITTYLLLTNKPRSITSSVSDRVKACSHYLKGKPGFYHCQKKNILFDNYSHRKYHCFCHQISFSYFYDKLIESMDVKYGTPIFDVLNDNKFCHYCECVYDYCCCRGNNDYEEYF
jgi:hypothetical protein